MNGGHFFLGMVLLFAVVVFAIMAQDLVNAVESCGTFTITAPVPLPKVGD